MFYLISGDNGERQIIDDQIFKSGNVWSCSQLVKGIKHNNEKLFYETVDGSLIHAGTIIKSSNEKKDLVAEGLKLKYQGRWYTIASVEGLDGLYVALIKPYDCGYIQVFTKIENLNLIEDVKC